MPTKARCDELGKKHRWQERKERYSPWSSQDVGSYWVCLDCGAVGGEAGGVTGSAT